MAQRGCRVGAEWVPSGVPSGVQRGVEWVPTSQQTRVIRGPTPLYRAMMPSLAMSSWFGLG